MTALVPTRTEKWPAGHRAGELADIDRIAVPPARRTPMLGRAWLQACYETLYPAGAARLLGAPGALGPFARRGGLVPTLFLAGSEELAEPIEPPVEDAAAAERLTDSILAQRLPVRFGHIPADGAFARVFADRAAARGVVLSKPVPGSPVLRLDDGHADPLARFNSRRRSDFRRMRKRAEAVGPVRFEFIAPSPAEVPALLDTAFAVEAKSWKARGGTALAQNRAQAAFLHRYGQVSAVEGTFRLAFMHVGDRIAAMQIGAEMHGAYWLFKIGYDEDFARASPGMLMMLESIRSATERGSTAWNSWARRRTGPPPGPRMSART